MSLLLLLLIFLAANVQLGAPTSCPNSTTNGDTKPLYLLVLMPMYGQEPVERNFLAATIAQEEINNRNDILPGYHIELIRDTIEVCSSSEAGIGLNKLVKHTVRPPCRPVVAVMGLVCSSHTAILSPVAGHRGFDLIQLSRASSPIFETQFKHFPHLWRFRGAATVYSDTVLAIMDQFNWTRVGIVYSVGSSLYSELAKDIEQRIKQSGNKSVAFSLGIRGTKAYYLDTVISNIKSTETGVLIKLLDLRRSKALLSYTYRHGLIYPHYTWIHVGTNPKWLKLEYTDVTLFFKSARGHLFLFSERTILNQNTYLVSNKSIFEYRMKYLTMYKKQIQNKSFESIILETHDYDQVWAIALALNNSLSEIKNRNLSIDNYTIGQPKITDVIEKNLKNIRFQGASGWIEFNQYRSVSNSIFVYWISANADYQRIGIYYSFNSLDFHLNINSSDLPSDTVPRVYEYILIPLPVAIVLYILTGGVIIFTTIQLILYLCYRRRKVVKATSPILSMVMFAGCYLFCAAAIQLNTLGSFVLSPETFTAMAIVNFILIINGISLILITLFIKLLQVYRIVTYWNKDLGKQWNTLPLFLAVLSLSIIPNICLAVLLALKPPTLSSYYYNFFRGNLPLIEIHTRIEPTSNHCFLIVAVIYTTVLLVLVFYMGIRIRKVKIKNFNSTGQVYLMLAVIEILSCLAISIVIIFQMREQESIASAVMVTLLLIFATTCQLILFFPKILSAMFDKKFPQAQAFLEKILTSIARTVFL